MRKVLQIYRLFKHTRLFSDLQRNYGSVLWRSIRAIQTNLGATRLNGGGETRT